MSDKTVEQSETTVQASERSETTVQDQKIETTAEYVKKESEDILATYDGDLHQGRERIIALWDHVMQKLNAIEVLSELCEIWSCFDDLGLVDSGTEYDIIRVLEDLTTAECMVDQWRGTFTNSYYDEKRQ